MKTRIEKDWIIQTAWQETSEIFRKMQTSEQGLTISEADTKKR